MMMTHVMTMAIRQEDVGRVITTAFVNSSEDDNWVRGYYDGVCEKDESGDEDRGPMDKWNP
jgi:hypothetical protein